MAKNRSSQMPYEEPIDRYDYVEDIYSSSGKRRQTWQAPKQPKQPKRRRMRGWVKALLVLLALVAAAVIAAVIALVVLFSRLQIQAVDTAQYVETPEEVAGYAVMDSSDVTNILIIGADSNQDGSEGRSDTMMVASINHKTNEVKLVSFLRDLYVSIPGYGYDRLNAAYSYGGAGLLMQTIENNFRIHIELYLETNFDGFEGIIDSVGGIDVTMTENEASYLSDWVDMVAVPGVNHLDGEHALYFARIRYLDSDFGRTTRQRQVISALLTKLKASNPITMYAAAYNLMPYLKTNMNYWQLVTTAFSLLKADFSDTLSIPTDGTYYDYTTPEGAMVLLPDYDANIQLLWQYLYNV